MRFNIKNRAPYARLVSHLYRLWDYDSCVEAQLKIWLAKHLLNRNNPGAIWRNKLLLRHWAWLLHAHPAQ